MAMNVNLKGCEIKIKIGDDIKVFTSDRELDDYIYNHRATLEAMIDGKIDKTFAQIENPFNSAIATFDLALEESKQIHNKTRNTANVSTKEKIGTMAVTRFNHSFGRIGNWKLPIADWNSERQERVEYFKKKGLTTEEAEIQAAIEAEATNIKSSNKTESDAAKFGTDIHSIFQKIIEGKSEAECKSGFKILHTFGDELIDNIYQQAKEMIEELKRRHPNAAFYPEFQFYSKAMNPKLSDILDEVGNIKNVNGKFDLIVIDKDGYAHIYDWKTSESEFDKWSATKLRDVKSQLGIYAAILEQYGLKVKSINVGCLKTTATKEGGKTVKMEVEAQGFQSFSMTSKVVLNAKQMFPSSNDIGTSELKNVDQKIEEMYPGKDVSTRKVLVSSVEEYKKDRVTEFKEGSDEYKKGWRYRFYADRILEYDDREIIVKEGQDLDKILAEYIEQLNEARATESLSFAKDLERCINARDTDALEKAAKEISSQYWQSIYNRFLKYVKQGWTLDHNEAMLANGYYVFTNGTRSELILLDNADLYADIELSEGKSILGNKLSDREVDDQFTLSSKLGNLLLMKAMVFISEHQDYFESIPIGNITVCSLHSKKAVSTLPSVLVENYEKLRLHYPAVNLKYIRDGIFQSTAEIGMNRAHDFLEISEAGVNRQLALTDMKIKPNVSLDELRSVIEDFEKRYIGNKQFTSMDTTDPILLAYNELLQTYAYLMGEWHMEIENDRGMYLTGGLNADGLMFTPIALANSANVRRMDVVMNAFSQKISTEFETQFAVKWQHYMKKLTKQWGAEGGGEWRFFKNWFVQDSKGNIDSSFRLKNPDTDSYFQQPGREVEKEACNFFLKSINAFRTQEQQEEEYYNVPLIRSGVLEMLARGENKATIVKELFKDWGDPIREALMGAADSSSEYLKNIDTNKLWNPMLGWESDARREALSKGVEYYETNLDIVFLSTMAWSIKCQAAKEFLPAFNMFRVSMLIENGNNEAKMKDISKMMTKYIQANVFNHNIMQESLQGAHKILNAVKKFVGIVALGLSFKSFVRENLSSAINTVVNITMAKEKTIFGDFDKKLYVEAMTTMALELAEGKGSIDDKIHQLNAIYRICDFGFSQMADSSKSNRYGLWNMSTDDLYLTSSLPDFYHRNAMLIMKLKSIGAWDAYSLDDEGMLQYDWKKDARFKILTEYDDFSKVPNERRQEYLKAKDTYDNALQDWKSLGSGYQDWTELKHALSPMDIKTLKAQADILYGNYDPEAKALVTKTFLGSLFFQFKTYGYARFLTWIKTGSATNVFMRDYVEMINDKGRAEKMVSIVSADGTDKIYKFESEVTEEEWRSGRAKYVMETKGGWMEGKIQSVYALASCIYNKDAAEFNRLMKDPVFAYNMRMALWDTIIMSIIAALISKLFEEGIGDNMSDADWFTQWSYNVLMGVAQDGPIWQVAKGMYSEGTLPMLTSLKRYMDTAFGVMSGSTKFLPAVLNTFGATKELSNYFNE